ncbi:tetratricopeptide repeat protein [Dactylosporangium sp. CA-139114]|uniref:tetratricopeptide repeat protein n=1 Tax=Dactylosporangium sp. CA-139114 TaxID=3239931 RepID=UPI003D966160
MAAEQGHLRRRAMAVVGGGLLVAAGVTAALANFVPWYTAAGLGALSGAAGLYGGVMLQRRAEAAAREAAWRAAATPGPDSVGDPSDGEGVVGLLWPARALVPYSVSHKPVLSRVTRWVEGRGDVVEAVLYVDGAAGSGKTRLLVEAAEDGAAVWGWARPGCGVAAVKAAAGLSGATVLVLDDAETRSDVAATVTAWARAAAPGVRVVVAGRVDEVWWSRLRAELPAEVVAVLPFRAQVTMPPLVAAGGRSQRQMFARALRYFTADGAAVPEAVWTPVHPPPSVALLHAGAAWAAHTAATGPVHAGAVVAEVFAVERVRWQAAAARAGLDRLPQVVFEQAVVLAALVGAADPGAARALLLRLPAITAVEDADRLADWLRGQYWQHEPDWLAPHLPAILLERYAAAVVAGTPALAAAVAGAAANDPIRAERLLLTLTRAAQHDDRAQVAITAVLRHDPYPLIAAAIAVASRMSGPLDPLLADHLADSDRRPLTAAQLLELFERIPQHARRQLLATTTVALLRLYLTDPDVDPNAVKTMASRSKLASVLYDQGRYAEAETEHRTVLEARTRVLGPEHRDTLVSRANLAAVLYDQARYAEAETEFRTVLKTWILVEGAEHRDTLASRNNLAALLYDQGRYAVAEAEYRTVLETFTRVLGAEHLDTLAARGNLALVLHGQARYAEAETEHRTVVEAFTRILSAEHPDTLTNRGNLANVLRDQGRYAEAEAEYRTVLDGLTRTLGAEHPDTLASRNDIANLLHDRGNPDAEAEYRTILEARTRVLGVEHPSTLASRGNLANVLYDQGRYAEAEVEYRTVVEARTRVLGAEHPDTLTCRDNLTTVLRDQGRYAEAEAEHRTVLEALIRVLGAEHPSTLASRGNLANVLYDQGCYAEAEAEYRTVLDGLTRTLGADHPDALTARNNLATVLRVQGRAGEFGVTLPHPRSADTEKDQNR